MGIDKPVRYITRIDTTENNKTLVIVSVLPHDIQKNRQRKKTDAYENIASFVEDKHTQICVCFVTNIFIK